MAYADIPRSQYEALAPHFNPVQFDAKAWVRYAQEAGMKYLVITAKHHDGFCMFDTDVCDYNAVQATPFQRDPLKELADACREAGIRFCVYYSILDWHHASQMLNLHLDPSQPIHRAKYQHTIMKAGRKQEYVQFSLHSPGTDFPRWKSNQPRVRC